MKRSKLTHFILSLCLFAFAGEALAIDISVLGLFRNKAIVKIDGKQRILKLGKASPEGVLLISSNSDEAVLEIDGVQNSYRLGNHIGSTFKRDAQPEVSIYKDELGMFTAVGSINNFPVNFLVDTGATYIAMNKNEARRLGIDFRQYGKRGYANTANGVAKTWNIVLSRVTVGDVTLNNVNASVIDSDSPREILLGMSFLGQLEMKNEGSALKLKKKF
ncbi:MAG: retroviral-like aspartic protease family protein [Sulfuriflexus sp.]|nr:retroviral-like aspartic protease family protein [Sulfuriflexus sp.]